uniref:Complex III subunit 9 n=1 Tax=Salix viminalis TaxID=40686 RepID=A0A6N2L5N0_SALVM
MDSTPRRSGGGMFEGIYKLIMRRNSIYVTFVIAGAFAGERAVDYGVRKLWEHNNVGVWGKGQQKNEFLSSSSHFEDSEQDI